MLIQTAAVQRPTATLDPYGNAVNTWSDVDSVPCRLVAKRQRIWSDERAESATVTSLTLLLPAGADAQERDRVEVDGATYVVTGLLRRNAQAPHHKSLTLERVS